MVTISCNASSILTTIHSRVPITRRRIMAGLVVIGVSASCVIHSMYGIEETLRHRILCANVMHSRERSLNGRRKLQDQSGCATYFPSGSGPSVAWETNFPVTDASITPDDEEEEADTPQTAVAYVTNYGGCPVDENGDPFQLAVTTTNPDGSTTVFNPDGTMTHTQVDGTVFVTNQNGPQVPISHTADSSNFLDTAAIQKHAISCVIPGAVANAQADAAATAAAYAEAAAAAAAANTETTTTTTTTTTGQTFTHPEEATTEAPTIYALVPESDRNCISEAGIEYDRALVLQNLGYHVKMWDSPISPDSQKFQELPLDLQNSITDTDLTELSKLQALKLTDHEFVVVFDQNFILKKPLDVVFDYMNTTADIAAYTVDPVTNAVDTGMIILKPSLDTFALVIDAFYDTPYTADTGWDDTGNSDLGPGGILKYVLDNPETSDQAIGLELDRCIYSNNADDTCNTAPYDEVVGYNLSNDVCGQPWMCTYDTDQVGWSDETVAMCDTFLKHWVTLRTDFAENSFNQQVAETNGDYHVEIYHGLCNGAGALNYIPIIPDTLPEIVNCLDNSMEFHGCDAALAQSETSQVGAGAEITVNVEFPQMCDVFYAPPGVNGATEINFSGTVELSQTGNSDTSMVFVIDRSGSTCDVANLGCSGDENQDFQVDDILDCEIISILGLIDKVRAEGTVSHVGLVSFSSTLRDIVPATIELPLTDINILDGNLVHAIENSIRSIDCGGATNYAAGMEKACEVIDTSTTEDNVIVFISDGLPTRGGAPSGPCTNNAVVHTIALGVDTQCEAENYPTDLARIATANDGTCQEIENVPDIRLILKEIADNKITSIAGTTVATESSVNFGCVDVPDFSTMLNLNCATVAPFCHTLFAGPEHANLLGQTADDSCCACGGGIYNDYGELDKFDSTIQNANTMDAKAYSHKVIVHPGEHTVCTQAIGISSGVPGMNTQCKKILVCNNPNDF